jgi:ammonia channel protein AmtB
MFTTEEIMRSIVLGCVITLGMMFFYGGLSAKRTIYKILFWSVAFLIWVAVLITITVLMNGTSTVCHSENQF